MLSVKPTSIMFAPIRSWSTLDSQKKICFSQRNLWNLPVFVRFVRDRVTLLFVMLSDSYFTHILFLSLEDENGRKDDVRDCGLNVDIFMNRGGKE